MDSARDVAITGATRELAGMASPAAGAISGQRIPLVGRA